MTFCRQVCDELLSGKLFILNYLNFILSLYDTCLFIKTVKIDLQKVQSVFWFILFISTLLRFSFKIFFI